MSYPTHPRDDLVDRAIRILGSTPIGQTPPAEERATVDAHVIPLLARLNAEHITYHVDAEGNVTQLEDPDAIPAHSIEQVAILLAEASMADFSIAALAGYDPAEAERQLMRVWSVGPSQEEYEDVVTDLDTDTDTIVTHRRNQTLIGEFF
jgi:hypothetical protein